MSLIASCISRMVRFMLKRDGYGVGRHVDTLNVVPAGGGSKSLSASTPLFLATTSLKSTWPERGPDVFLGEWCFRFPEDAQLARDADVAPYPWSDFEARTKGLVLCWELTLRIAMRLAPFFSTLLQDRLDERGVNLLLVPVLERVVMATYHNFVCLKGAVAQYGPLRSAGLRREDYLVPETTEMLIDQLRRDEFQLQLFSEICPPLGISLELQSRRDFTAKSTPTAPASPGVIVQPRRSLTGRILREVAKSVSRLQSRRADCVLYNANFSLPESCVLAVKSRFRIATLPLVKIDSVAWPGPALHLRDELATQLASILSDDPFEKALGKLVPAIWPLSLLEGLSVLKTVVADNFPQRPKTIASGMAWNADDAFKLWCVQSLKRGSRLVSCQHGGGYGKRYVPDLAEQVEYSIVDRFISWGGSGNQARSCVTLPVLPHFLVKRASTPDERILYVGTCIDGWPMTITIFPFGAMYLEYVERQIAFWRALPPGLQANLLLRSNPFDAGWSALQRLHFNVPRLMLDDFSRPFNERLRHAKLVVVDNPSTTLFQSMGSGVPTILVWHPNVWVMNEVASAYFDHLEAAGVYFRCPKAAAEAVARIWRDPQQWWETPQVAGPVNKFLDQYMKRERDWVRPWLQELQHRHSP